MHHITWRAAFLTVVLVAVGLLGLTIALTSAPAPAPADEALRERARTLTAHRDADTLAPFTTRSDKSYCFSTDWAAVIGYRVLFGVALAGGDPVGAAASTADAITAFVDLCGQRGWRPAVLGAGASTVRSWQQAGVRRGIVFGDEAILHVRSFSLANRRMRNVRQAVRRTVNAGVRVRIGTMEPALTAP